VGGSELWNGQRGLDLAEIELSLQVGHQKTDNKGNYNGVAGGYPFGDQVADDHVGATSTGMASR